MIGYLVRFYHEDEEKSRSLFKGYIRDKVLTSINKNTPSEYYVIEVAFTGKAQDGNICIVKPSDVSDVIKL